MSRTIRMLDVKFGDCFILSEENHDRDALIVDCGSDNAVKGNVLRSFQTIENSKISRCLLSHFHNDHYAGFNWIANRGMRNNSFDEIILPNVFCYGNIFKINLAYLTLLNRSIRAGKAAKSAYNYVTSTVHFAKLIKKEGRFLFVSEGARFCVGTTRFKVLHPKISKLKQLDDECAVFIHEFESALETNEPELYVAYRRIYEKFSILSQARVDNEIEYLYAEILGSFIQQSEEIIDDISHLMSFVPSRREWANDFLNDLEFISISTRLWNAYSVVFMSEDEKPLLMTGDMTNAAWKQDIFPLINGINFSTIKAPHHGTNRHFVNNFSFQPNGKLLISNCGYANRRIAINYPQRYLNQKVFCTDNRFCCFCEYMQKHKARCPQGQSACTIVVPY